MTPKERQRLIDKYLTELRPIQEKRLKNGDLAGMPKFVYNRILAGELAEWCLEHTTTKREAVEIINLIATSLEMEATINKVALS